MPENRRSETQTGRPPVASPVGNWASAPQRDRGTATWGGRAARGLTSGERSERFRRELGDQGTSASVHPREVEDQVVWTAVAVLRAQAINFRTMAPRPLVSAPLSDSGAGRGIRALACRCMASGTELPP